MDNNANKVFVTKAFLPPIDEYIREIESMWETHKITNMGDKHKKLESELKSFLGVSNISLMVNGHMALELAIQAMGLTGEVITTPYTFASTTHAIVRNGLVPVFCDINPDTFTIDADKIENLITEKTSAIVPVHVYGNICDVEKIDEIAKRYNLRVIYDAAHAFGEAYKGIGIGNFGDASMFSFHATKVFNTIEGGAVCFNDEEYGLDLYRLKNFGIRNQETVDFVGANAKMNEFQAAMGLCNLRHVENQIVKRKKVFELYSEALKTVSGIRLNKIQKDLKYNYSYFPIVIDEKEYGIDRNKLFSILAESNIYCRKYFYPLTSEFDCYRERFKGEDTPVAKRISDSVITLPLYPDIEIETIEWISDIIKKSQNGKRL